MDKMLEKKTISSELFCFLYKNKKKMFSTGSLMRAGLVQIASEMNQEALSIHTGQWYGPITLDAIGT